MWPDSDLLKSYKSKLPDKDSYPRADDCILELVNAHLKVSSLPTSQRTLTMFVGVVAL